MYWKGFLCRELGKNYSLNCRETTAASIAIDDDTNVPTRLYAYEFWVKLDKYKLYATGFVVKYSTKAVGMARRDRTRHINICNELSDLVKTIKANSLKNMGMQVKDMR